MRGIEREDYLRTLEFVSPHSLRQFLRLTEWGTVGATTPRER